MTEKYIEKKLREIVSDMGGLAVKFASPYFTGMPDRVVFMPGGKIWFVELKAPGKKTSPRQDIVHRQLRELGVPIRVVGSTVELNEFFKLIEK